MAGFDLILWNINMKDDTYEKLIMDPVVQAKFVHEYIHYIQSLMGTLGRVILAAMLRLSVLTAGAIEGYTKNSIIVPIIDVLNILRSANIEDISDIDLLSEYKILWDQLQFTIHVDSLKDKAIVDIDNPFERNNHSFGRYSKEDYIFIRGKMNNENFYTPLSEWVILENMARQVQRNYLIHNNNGNASEVDRLREEPYEFYYTCLYDIIKYYMPKNANPQDPAAWTITICQYAILCGNPNVVFELLFNHLREFQGTNLKNDFLLRLKYDDSIKKQFDNPSLQEVISEIKIYFKFAMSKSQADINKLLQYIEHAYYDLSRNVLLFSTTQLNWEGVLRWIRSYGCPPIEFKDGKREDILGIDILSPWQPYLEQTHRLLFRKIQSLG